MDFQIHDTNTAPEESQKILEGVESKFGFIPNLLGELSESPATLQGYLKLDEIIGSSSLSAKEQQLAILAVSIENGCNYCIAVHSSILKKQLNVDEEIVDSVRSGEALENEKWNTLVNFTRAIVRERGHVSEEDLKKFFDAGYERRNILEINLIVALKTISNYTNHIADTPVDEAFKSEEVEAELV